jgi:hypothetical protein
MHRHGDVRCIKLAAVAHNPAQQPLRFPSSSQPPGLVPVLHAFLFNTSLLYHDSLFSSTPITTSIAQAQDALRTIHSPRFYACDGDRCSYSVSRNLFTNIMCSS